MMLRDIRETLYLELQSPESQREFILAYAETVFLKRCSESPRRSDFRQRHPRNTRAYGALPAPRSAHCVAD